MKFRVFQILTGVLLVGLAGFLVWSSAGIFKDSDGDTVDLIKLVLVIVVAMAIMCVYYYALWAKSGIHRVMENIFSIPELLKKLAFTLGLLCIYRIGFHLPLPGLDPEQVAAKLASAGEGAFGDAIAYLSIFSGGNLQKTSLFGLGIMPYISASIILQLLTTVIPSLEKLSKEGPAGRKKIQEYTRYLTVVLCLVQAIMWMKYMTAGEGMVYADYKGSILVMVMGVIGLTTGTLFLMWLGEQIDEYGIGNGISLLIMAGIVVRLPTAIIDLYGMVTPSLTGVSGDDKIGILKLLFIMSGFVFVVAGAILITQGQRRIPIQQAKQVRGRRMTAGGRHYMPLRVNHGGVMPIIFASSLMIFPGAILGWLTGYYSGGIIEMMSNAFRTGAYTHSVCYIALIFFFAYFWTTVQFRPKDMADQLRDNGHFIPGLRPGRRTAEYLERVMERITYCGASF
ncbi:MAG TPA: preprotein translocase subunit SecY, partial [Phycisphaerae bacterium]|nr:preprotein translocase subunit SecY [Phycisphaerae bacterium]